MKIKIIPYNIKYRKKILELWNQELITDPLSEKRFLEKILLDENFDPNYCLVALSEDNKVIGFIWSVVRKVPYGDRGTEPERGWIASIFVDKDYQRQGIGSQLVNTVEEKMINKGIKNITLGAYSPNYLFPGIDKNNYPNAKSFFEKLGYEKHGEAVSMERSLFDFVKTQRYLDLYEKVLKKGYTLTSFSLDDAEELLEFLHTHFEGGWARNIQNAILNDEAHETVLVLRDSENEIVGYAQRAIDGSPDRFGPFGVMEKLRGEGLGAILFNEMLFDMLSKGISHAYFLWTSGNAQKFYERNGMKVYRDYNLMKKYIN